jgi:hypothetical protein
MQHPYENIPSILKQRPNWVCWGIRDAPLKAPFNPASLLYGRPSPAKSGIQNTWGSYQAAVECVGLGLAKGIGYEFDGDSLFGIDLDNDVKLGFLLVDEEWWLQDDFSQVTSYYLVTGNYWHMQMNTGRWPNRIGYALGSNLKVNKII